MSASFSRCFTVTWEGAGTKTGNNTPALLCSASTSLNCPKLCDYVHVCVHLRVLSAERVAAALDTGQKAGRRWRDSTALLEVLGKACRSDCAAQCAAECRGRGSTVSGLSALRVWREVCVMWPCVVSVRLCPGWTVLLYRLSLGSGEVLLTFPQQLLDLYYLWTERSFRQRGGRRTPHLQGPPRVGDTAVGIVFLPALHKPEKFFRALKED